jgi:4-hydroxy 2-oxovalerate aldolase
MKKRRYKVYRPQITVVDCTIRDGGLMNNSKFSMKTVKAVYKALCASNIHIIELGYRNSRKMFCDKEVGPWRFCDDDLLRQVVDGIDTNTKLAVMMDAHKSEAQDLNPKDESPVDMVRAATYVKDVDKAINLANIANDLGYDTTINIMAISHAIDRELDEALLQIEEETKVLACYIVDSFGSLYSEDIDYYVHKFQKHLKTKEVGVHCHNHQQLAFANTIEGIIRGANYLDGTIYGIGRAAGNCPLELLIGFLKNPKFDIRPIFEVLGSDIVPLRETIEWGYLVPYMICGILNMHPKDAMELMGLKKDDPKRMDFKAFFDHCSEV